MNIIDLLVEQFNIQKLLPGVISKFEDYYSVEKIFVKTELENSDVGVVWLGLKTSKYDELKMDFMSAIDGSDYDDSE